MAEHLNTRIQKAFQTGFNAFQALEWPTARASFDQVLKVDPAQPTVRYLMSMVAQGEGQADEAIEHLRVGLDAQRGSREPPLRFRLNRLLRQFEIPAEPRDLLDGPIPNIVPNLAMFGPPASGVEKWGTALAKVLGLKAFAAVDGGFENEPDLALAPLLESASEPAMLRQFCRCTEPTLQLLQVFAPRPVFVVQPLVDSISRLADGLADGRHPPDFTAGYGPMLPRRTRLDYAARRWGPWLIEQYASFWWAHHRKRLDVLFVPASSLFSEPTKTAEKILTHAGYEAPEDFETATAEVFPGVPPLEEDDSKPVDVGWLKAFGRGFPGVDLSPLFKD